MYPRQAVCKSSEYDKEIPLSQTAEKHVALLPRATQQPEDTRKKNEAKQPTRWLQN